VTRPQPDPTDPATLAGPWRRRLDTGWRSTPIGLVLLPPHRPDPVTVAGSAVAVWELLAEPITRADLAGRVAERFGADPAAVLVDLGPLLAQLLDLDAIERA
jgi:hypothetical protein